MIDHRSYVKTCLRVSSERFVPVMEDFPNWLLSFVLYTAKNHPFEREQNNKSECLFGIRPVRQIR